jgi:hypothetical protein
VLCERALLTEIGLFDTRLGRLEDWDWLIRLTGRQPLGFVAEPLARIEPSTTPDPAKVTAAAARLWHKHAAELSPRPRRHFAAALDLVQAAAYYRADKRLSAALHVGRSLLRVPAGNAAFAAVLHNRRLAPAD